ncbi:MAG: hypothetical protein DSZ29_07945, partial [Aquificaceae bacterium]
KAHPDVAQSLNNLALLYQAQEKYSQALPLFEQAIAILKTSFPNGHPNIDTTQNSLKILRDEMG